MAHRLAQRHSHRHPQSPANAKNAPAISIARGKKKDNSSNDDAPPSIFAQQFDRLMERFESIFGPIISPAQPSAATSPPEMSRKLKQEEATSDMLFELDRILTRVERSAAIKHQATLEKLLLDKILVKCDNYVMRGIASSCVVKLFEHSSHNVSNWYHDLLRWLEGKEQNARIIALKLFASLSRRFGSQFLLSTPEILGILMKLSRSRDELVIKELILDVIAGYYEGTGGSARSAGSNETTHLDMVKIISRFIVDKQSNALRKHAARTCVTVLYYSIDARELDPLLSLVLKSLPLESESDVRFVLAESMGEMLALAVRKDWKRRHADAQAQAKKTHTKPVRKTQGELRNIGEVMGWMERLLATTNQKSTAASALHPSNLALRTAYMQICLRFLRSICAGNAHNIGNGSVRHGFSGALGGEDASLNVDNSIDENNVVDVVLRALTWLDKTKFVHGSANGYGNVLLGGTSTIAAMALSPAASAVAGVVDPPADCNVRQWANCVSHMILHGVLPFQSERGLEAVGKAIVSFLNQLIKSGGTTPAASGPTAAHNDILLNNQCLVSFQLLSFIFARLGLAVECMDLKDSCLESLLFFLPHPQYALRIGASQCLRALARAASPQIATWLSVIYKVVVMQLIEVTEHMENNEAAQQTKTASPRGRRGPPSDNSIDPAVMFSLHGHISALAAIVGVIPEAPCGVPSVIIESIFDVSKKLLSLTSNGESSTPNVNITPSLNIQLHSLVEGGWLLLSSLVSLGSHWVSPRLSSLFQHWRACLGRKAFSGKQRQEDINLELKVRAKALVALRTFVQIMRSRWISQNHHNGHSSSPLLKATIPFLRTTFSLLKALHGEKDSLEPSVLTSLAQVKSVLMDVFAALPSTSYASITVPLLHMVVSEFTSKNPPLCSELPGILAPADVNLNSPFISSVACPTVGIGNSSPGIESDYIRFLDLADLSDSSPIVSPVTGQPIPSPTSFYDNFYQGGNILPDYSWNWCMRAQVQTEVRKEMQMNMMGGSHAQQQITTPTIGSSPSSGSNTPGVTGNDGAMEEIGADRDGIGYSEDDPSSSLSTPSALLNDSSSTDGVGGASGDDLPFSTRILWSSLRNHQDRSLSFPACHSLECFDSAAQKATNSAVRLFATIYANQSQTHKEQLIKHFLAIVTKAKNMNSMHTNIVTNIATALLAITRDLAERDAGGLQCAAASDTLLTIASELMSVTNPMVRRAVGEMVGLLVRVEDDDTIVSKLFTTLQNQIHAKDQNTVCTAVFALGCVHRYGGAMKTMKNIPFTVAALQTLGRDFSEPFRIWVLHALWLAIDTGGLSFTAYVQPTLSMLQAHANADIDVRTPAVTQTIGRIIHAVLGALGPEVAASSSSSSSSSTPPGSSNNVVDKFLNLWIHLQHDDVHASSRLEVVNIMHQLVLWSDPLQYPALLPVLVRALSSEEEEVRRSALKCLLQLGEKDPAVISQKNFEKRLMSMMDTEMNYGMVALIKHTITTWIISHATNQSITSPRSPTIPPAALSPLGVQANPTASQRSSQSRDPQSADESIRYRLFDVCKRTIVGSHRLPSDSQMAAAAAASNMPTKSKRAVAASMAMDDDKGMDDDDDDDGILAASSDPSRDVAPSLKSRGRRASVSGECDRLFVVSESRWQSKAFALDSLASLLRYVHKSCPRTSEFDLAYARKHALYPLQYAVQQLPDLLTVTCLATSSVYDPLRIKGTQCMKVIVELFADVKDPDAVHVDDDPDTGGDALLLQVYSAQVTSALSQSMKNKSESVASAPQLRAKACELAVVYLTSGVTSDSIVFSRMLKLLLEPVLHPADTLANLNNQFDGNMGTMLILCHLHALAQLHASVLDNPAPSSRKKSSRPLTPRQRAIATIRETLSPHFPLLTLHYFQCLKDLMLISNLPHKDVTKLVGYYFDGANTSNPLPVYLAHWDAFLTNLCHTMKKENSSGEAGRAARAATSMIIASDGSTGSDLAKRELVSICLGVIGTVLQLMAQHESSLASGERRASMVGSPFAIRSKRSSNLDAAALYRADREKEQPCSTICLNALAALLREHNLRADRVSASVLMELLPLVNWNLTHRPSGVEPAILLKRQEACIMVLQQLTQYTLPDVIADDSKLQSFLTGAETQIPLDGSGGDASPLLDILHSIGDMLVSAVHQFLPTFGGASSPQSYQFNLHKLSEASVYLTPDVDHTLVLINNLLSVFNTLVATISQQEGNADLRVHHHVLSLHLLQHIIRKAPATHAQAAFNTAYALLLSSMIEEENETESPPLLLPPIIAHQTALQIKNVLLNPLPLHSDFRVEFLFGLHWLFLCSWLKESASDTDVSIGVSEWSAVWMEFMRHPSDRFRIIAMRALHKHVLVTPPNHMHPTKTLVRNKAIMALLQQITATLMSTVHGDSTAEERANGVQCLTSIFHALPDSYPPAPTIKERLMSILLPLLVDTLAVLPESVTFIFVLATQHATLFKANVSLLPLDYRARLQSAVMSMSAEQQQAALAHTQSATNNDHAQTGTAASTDKTSSSKSKTSEGGKKRSKKRESSDSAFSSAPSAPSIDFSKFTKK